MSQIHTVQGNVVAVRDGLVKLDRRVQHDEARAAAFQQTSARLQEQMVNLENNVRQALSAQTPHLADRLGPEHWQQIVGKFAKYEDDLQSMQRRYGELAARLSRTEELCTILQQQNERLAQDLSHQREQQIQITEFVSLEVQSQIQQHFLANRDQRQQEFSAWATPKFVDQSASILGLEQQLDGVCQQVQALSQHNMEIDEQLSSLETELSQAPLKPFSNNSQNESLPLWTPAGEPSVSSSQPSIPLPSLEDGIRALRAQQSVSTDVNPVQPIQQGGDPVEPLQGERKAEKERVASANVLFSPIPTQTVVWSEGEGASTPMGSVPPLPRHH